MLFPSPLLPFSKFRPSGQHFSSRFYKFLFSFFPAEDSSFIKSQGSFNPFLSQNNFRRSYWLGKVKDPRVKTFSIKNCDWIFKLPFRLFDILANILLLFFNITCVADPLFAWLLSTQDWKSQKTRALSFRIIYEL